MADLTFALRRKLSELRGQLAEHEAELQIINRVQWAWPSG